MIISAYHHRDHGRWFFIVMAIIYIYRLQVSLNAVKKMMMTIIIIIVVINAIIIIIVVVNAIIIIIIVIRWACMQRRRWFYRTASRTTSTASEAFLWRMPWTCNNCDLSNQTPIKGPHIPQTLQTPQKPTKTKFRLFLKPFLCITYKVFPQIRDHDQHWHFGVFSCVHHAPCLVHRAVIWKVPSCACWV